MSLYRVVVVSDGDGGKWRLEAESVNLRGGTRENGNRWVARLTVCRTRRGAAAFKATIIIIIIVVVRPQTGETRTATVRRHKLNRSSTERAVKRVATANRRVHDSTKRS